MLPPWQLLIILLLVDYSHRKVLAKRRKCPGSLSEDKIIAEIFKNYTKKLPESDEQDESVHVQIELHVQDMGSLNEITADFEIDVLFTQLWHDPNLSFRNLSSQCVRNITMESRYLKDIWTPNTCIINAKKTSVHASPTDNIMFILYENGTVWINHRLSVKAPCNLDLRTFPFDTQNCVLLFESYSHNSEEVTLHWMAEPITLMKQITLPDFDMIQFDTRRETLLYPNGRWSQLEVGFTFKRRYGFYILQAYVPTYLTIIVSWVGFCMEPKALPARTTVGVSSLLALTLQFGNIHKNLPRVSYIKAMDVWMLSCISFVFGTMIELAIVCYITRRQSSKKAKAKAIVRRASMAPHPELVRFDASPSQRSSVRVNTLPVRNGSVALQRRVSNCSSLGPLLFNRKKRWCSTKNRTNGNTDYIGGGVDGTTTLIKEEQRPIKLILPRSEGNGDLRRASNEKSESANSSSCGDQFSIPELHSPIFSHSCRPSHYLSLARGLSLTEENWPVIQPESIDKLSIVIFPLTFTLFNLIYWWHYLFAMNGQSNGAFAQSNPPSLSPPLANLKP
nr:mod-1 [Meloidogyne graminicola]